VLLRKERRSSQEDEWYDLQEWNDRAW
jgi:hypothetical protein